MTIGITELPPEGMQLGGVALAGDSARGTRTTEGLSLLFTTAGITVQGPQPQIERLLVWSGLDSASCHEKIVLPDGRNAAVMELTSGGQSIRFLLPSDTVSPGQAAYLDQALPAWLARYRSAEDHALGLHRPGAGSADPFAAAAAAAGALSDQAPPPPPTQPPPSAPASTAGQAPAGATPAGAAAAAAGASPPGAVTAGASPAGAAAAGAASRPGQADPGRSSEGNLNGTGAQIQTAPAPGSESPTTGARPTTAKSDADSPAAAGPNTSSAGIATPVTAPPGRPPQAGASPSQSGQLAEAAPSTAGAGATPPAPPAKAPPQAGDGVTAAPAASSTPTGAAPSAGAPPSTPPPVPPPPPAPGTVTWVLSVDPMAPGTEWDNPPLGDELAGEGSPKKRWGRRKAKAALAGGGAESGAAATGAAVSGAAMAGTAAPAAPAAASESPTTTSPSQGPGTGTGTAASPSPAAEAPPDAPMSGAGGPAQAPRAAEATQRRDYGPGGARTTTENAVAEPTGSEPAAEGRPRRTRLLALGVALLAVIGAIAYLAVSRSNTSSQSTSPAVPPSAARAADGAMVASINLRLADLPPGWMASSPSTPPLHLPLASPATEAQAAQTLSACLGVPLATAHGLFAGGPLPGQTAVALSQTFVQGVEPGIQMHSMTTSVASPAQAQADAAVFENPDFVACYGQFERTVAAASIPGATASVQSVTLQPPTGAKSFGYITTVTSPQGTGVFGQAFMIGGRIVTDLMPATNGPQIPSADFTLAYDAIGGRISADVSK